LFDFTEEIYLLNAVNRGFVKNVTEEILLQCNKKPGIFERTIKPLERKKEYGGGFVAPKYESTSYSVPYILPEDVDTVKSCLRTGDIIMFLQVPTPARPFTVFGHGGIIIKGNDLPGNLKTPNNIPDNDDNIYFIHSSLSRGMDETPLGVCIACKEFVEGIYDKTKPRLLSHYLQGVLFPGIAVFRLTPGNGSKSIK